ncbi:uncharacterized protein [Centruroides vittatus]|uniref:uncharacterized protein n=1 Tax=Centruroides vittatus TaxID=120091 RepID=UPI00350ED6F2
MILNDIKEISVALKNCKFDKIKILHKFIFNTDGDRSNRKRIRNFSGFTFALDSDDFNKKLKSIESDFSLNELITISNILNISFEGNKSEVAKRILADLCVLESLAQHVRLDVLSGSESEADEPNEKNESGGELSMQCDMNKNKNSLDSFIQSEQSNAAASSVPNGVTINYSDIESTISKFNAESHENVIRWIEHFENISKLFSLSELQKFIFAKRSLGGNASLFVRTVPEINSWQRLKQALIDEFSFEINSAKLHEILSKRTMQDSESVQEYYLKMKELCNFGKIDDGALMHYVIKGINDKHENKIILYGCKDLSEFKEKLKVYEVIKGDSVKGKGVFDRVKPRHDSYNRNNNTFDRNKPRYENYRSNAKYENANKNNVKQNGYVDNRSNRICYNCGSRNHISKYCIHKDKGLKCFQCEAFGHKASECPKSNSKPELATLDIAIEPKLFKTIVIGNMSIKAVMDTGSQATLLRKSVFDKLGFRRLFPTNSTLNGFGKSVVDPLGCFTENIQIDDFKCRADVCVVANDVMTCDAIVGLNVLMQGETTINESGIIIKNKTRCVKEINCLSILPIDLTTTGEIDVNIEPDVPNIFKSKVQQLVLDYVPHKVERTNVELNILVKNHEPIFHQPRRLPFSEKRIVETQVAEWLKQGIIESSSSEYCSPVVVVKKKNGTPRVCIDYR